VRPAPALESPTVTTPGPRASAPLVATAQDGVEPTGGGMAEGVPPSGPSREETRKPKSELELGALWVEALRDKDVKALAARSVFPFEFRDSGLEGHCEAYRVVAAPGDLGAAVDCLMKDDLLGALLRSKPGPPPVETQPDGYVEPWAKAWRTSIPNGSRLFLSYYDRNDATLTLLLLIGKDGVHGVWKTGTDATKEVAIAEQWRAALRDGDVAALTRLASYPFELRDAGLNSHCRKGRTAKTPEQMPTVLSCFTTDKVLRQALHGSPDSTVEASRLKSDVPGSPKTGTASATTRISGLPGHWSAPRVATSLTSRS
jgi:hypothetical protein